METMHGRIFRVWRKVQGLQAKAVSLSMGRYPGYIENFEKRRNPSLNLFLRVADAHGLNVVLVDQETGLEILLQPRKGD